jgi:hypothetical protein
MKKAVQTAAAAVACTLFAMPAVARPPHVDEQYGSVTYTNASGVTCPLSQGGNFGEPVLSPDGRLAAFIHIDGQATDPPVGPPTSLWLADTTICRSVRLISSNGVEYGQDAFNGFGHPIFSLDGNFIYVTGAFSAVSPAVHQINIATREQRFVINGAAVAVIRTGPYRGYLIVGRHMYYAPPQVGSYDAVFVVRPDTKEVFQIPGSDADDGQDHIHPWLQAHGWSAW